MFWVGRVRCTQPKRVLPWSKICAGARERQYWVLASRAKFGGGGGTYGIDALEEDVPQDVKGHVASALDAAVDEAALRGRKAQGLLLDRELLVADRERDRGQLVRRRRVREDVALLRGVVLGARDGGVDGLAGGVVDETERGARVGDGRVARASDAGAVDGGGGAVEHPEALRVVDRGVIDLVLGDAGVREGGRVDEAEGVEGFALVARVGGVAPGAQVRGEELHGLGDVGLRDHVLHGGLHGGGGDGVDAAKGEAEEAVAGVLLELRREGFGKLDALVLDGQTAKGHVVGTDGA